MLETGTQIARPGGLKLALLTDDVDVIPLEEKARNRGDATAGETPLNERRTKPITVTTSQSMRDSQSTPASVWLAVAATVRLSVRRSIPGVRCA